MEGLKKYLEELKEEVKKEISTNTAEFNDLNDAESYQFYNGFFDALNSITDYINTGRKREII